MSNVRPKHTMETLYHYTNPNGFFNIIKSKKLWLSAAHNLNDHQEIRWATQKVAQILERTANPENKDFLTELWQQVKINSLTPFICSFSTKGDLLSQWRAYAGDGTGACIGFNLDLLPKSKSLPAHTLARDDRVATLPIIYDEEGQQKVIEGIIQNYLSARTSSAEPSDAIINASHLINGLSPTFKNPAFHEESEWRMIHVPMIMGDIKTNATTIYNSISNVQHRISGEKLTTYFEFDFSRLIEKGGVAEIILGPKCQFTPYDLEIFLSVNGFKSVSYRRSTASYR